MTEAEILHTLQLANRLATARVSRYAAAAGSASTAALLGADTRLDAALNDLRAYLESLQCSSAP